MTNYNANPHKTAGNDAKPAEIVLTDETTIDAAHHFRTEDNAYVCVYVSSRENGLDYRIPREQVRYIDTTDDTFESDQVAGNTVCYFGELFKIARTACGHAELVPVDEFGERVIKYKHQDVTDRLHVGLSEVEDVPDGWSQ